MKALTGTRALDLTDVLSGQTPAPVGNQHFYFFPYGVYRARDTHVILACVQDKAYAALAYVLGNATLREPRFAQRAGRVAEREHVDRLIGAAVAEWNGEDLLHELDARGVPCAPVNTVDRALQRPRIAARNKIVETTHPRGRRYRMPGNPVKLWGTPCEEFGPPPLIGERSEQVLRELLDMDQATITRVQDAGVPGAEPVAANPSPVTAEVHEQAASATSGGPGQ